MTILCSAWHAVGPWAPPTSTRTFIRHINTSAACQTLFQGPEQDGRNVCSPTAAGLPSRGGTGNPELGASCLKYFSILLCS